MIGAGVIGSLFAGHLAQVAEVSVLTRRQEHADALAAEGLRVSGRSDATSTNDTAGVELKSQANQLWEAGMGEGFRSSSETLSLQAGPLFGVHILGGTHWHDMVLSSLSYGHMLGETVGRGCWYRGNWELRGELFGGVEYSPSNQWVLGVTPHVRYNFATGTRW